VTISYGILTNHVAKGFRLRVLWSQ